MGGICPSLREEAYWLIDHSRTPRLRALRQFAEQCVVIPDGMYRGQRLRVSRQPFTGLFFDELAANRWRKVFIVGPTQSGKTLLLVTVILYYLVELRAKVAFGIPDMKMAHDKWAENILPALQAAGFDKYLPTKGSGSRGGRIDDAVAFSNGASLKIISGGGGDAVRSGYTAQVVAITELDKLDLSSETSREADKVTQMAARTDAYDDQALVIGESTASFEQGRVWREYTGGTASRIACLCPHCSEYVTPDRGDLLGWQTAQNVIEARESAYWSCPICKNPISEAERIAMNRAALLLHRGQAVTLIDGKPVIQGELPKTDTFGFRWNAFNNMFWTAASVAAREWRAKNDPDEENSEKAMRQFVWALPYDPPEVDLTALEWTQVTKLTNEIPRGHVPIDATEFVLAADPGKRLVHWLAMAFRSNGSPHVVDYGIVEVKSDDLGEERALLLALRDLRELCEAGWIKIGGAERIRPGLAFVDSGWHAEIVYAMVRESAASPHTAWYATKGLGAGQSTRIYQRPRNTTANIVEIGEGYHVSRLSAEQLYLLEADADAWKAWTHARLKTPRDEPGAMTLFAVNDWRDHTGIAKHFTAEKQIEEFQAGRGVVIRWENTARKQNHWFDCAYLCGVAGHWAGARLTGEEPMQTARERHGYREGLKGLDGRSFVATGR